MAKSTCLHIQDRESGPIRVVEIPWISVRIGRAAFCEVRLSEHDLADVACRLKRVGSSWHLVSVATPSSVSLDGRPLDRSAPLPYDVPFHVGGYCLTLRQDQTAEPNWDAYTSPHPQQLEAAGPTAFPAVATAIRVPLDVTAAAVAPAVERASQAARRPATTKPGTAADSSSSPAEILKHRWETRWRAAGVEIKSRAARYSTPTDPARATYGTAFEPVPLKDAAAPRSAPVVPPRGERNRASVSEPELADAKLESPIYSKPFSETQPRRPDHARPATDAPEIEVEREVTSDDSAMPQAAPLSFWDNWSPSDDMIESLGKAGAQPDDRGRADELSETAELSVEDAISSRVPDPADFVLPTRIDSSGQGGLPPAPPITEPESVRDEDVKITFGDESKSLPVSPTGDVRPLTPDSSPREGEGNREAASLVSLPPSPLGGEGARTPGEGAPRAPQGNSEIAGLADLPPSPLRGEGARTPGEGAAVDAQQERQPLQQGDAAQRAGEGPGIDAQQERRPLQQGESRRAEIRAGKGPGVGAQPEFPHTDRREAAFPSGSAPTQTRGGLLFAAPVADKRDAVLPGADRAKAAPLATRPSEYDDGREPEADRDRGRRREVSSASMRTGADDFDWPSARDILAMHQASQRATQRLAPPQKTRGYALPTVAREPGRWDLPAWLAGPPIAILVLVCGAAGCILSLAWAADSYSASIMTERLYSAKAGSRIRPLPAGVVPPEGTWVRTTAQHLAHWALYARRASDADAEARPVDVRGLIERALQVAPINPTARLAIAQLDHQERTTVVATGQLGLSRDAVSLAASASWLLAAGRKDAALRMYRKALEIASHRELSPYGVPRFNEDPAVPRYLLPGEDAVREVVRVLASQSDWTFVDWSEVLPQDTTVSLVVARIVREQGKREAEPLFDMCLRREEPRSQRRGVLAVSAAARAEAHALQSHWKEAEQEYRQAIELIDDDTVKRSWWFNLADVASHLDDEGQRQAALRAALAVANSDDISRRATEKERSAGPRARLRSTGTKAN
jgi:tetratricopeptide (TPR) repeat protein